MLQKITLIELAQGAGGYGSKGAGTAEHPKSNFGLFQHLLLTVMSCYHQSSSVSSLFVCSQLSLSLICLFVIHSQFLGLTYFQNS